MHVTERIRIYLDFKGITKYKFSKDTGFSNGFLDKERAIGSDKCEKILEIYADINPKWLITGRGEMLIKTENKDFINQKNIPIMKMQINEKKGVVKDNSWQNVWQNVLNNALENLIKEGSAFFTNKEIALLKQRIKELEAENNALKAKIAAIEGSYGGGGK